MNTTNFNRDNSNLIIIEKKNEVYITVNCESDIQREISEFFTFYVPGYKFMPAFRNRMWDGKIRLFSQKTKEIYFGLYPYIKAFAEERGYNIVAGKDVEIDNKVDKETVTKFSNSLGQKFEARDYQIDAIYHSLKRNRALLVSPTASGKSFIIYSLIRYYSHLIKDDDNNRTLLIVPTTSLVEQMYTDFESYGWNVKKYCHRLYSGYSNQTDKKVLISTWQSLYKLPKEYFKQFGCVFGDEAHLFKSKSLTEIMTKLLDCKYRIGLTGTLDGAHTHKLVLEGLFGAVNKVTTTKKLMDKKQLSNLAVRCLILKHNEANCKIVANGKYQDEIDYLVSSKARNNFIRNLALKIKGNTLVLFQLVEKHGKDLFKSIEDKAEKDRKVFYIYGGVETEEREKARAIVENESDAIIVASYGTFSTGINIKNLHNIIFASPSKSRIRNLQSIGRGLRLGDNKVNATLYDIADDLIYKSKENYTLKHFQERINIYNEEEFDYEIHNINLKD
ncbi:MAG: DEAD/DEAH box helicase family protein [Pelagibacterales bacterium]|nr:DEAD/DEAH box helicase family protein [Pelagibacterales bacterium]